jgi:hypothetical protein
MKKLFLGIILGFVVHMLYLDGILIRQAYIVDHCPDNEKPDKHGNLPCLMYANEIQHRVYLKYFGIYRLIKWNKLVTGKWKAE